MKIHGDLNNEDNDIYELCFNDNKSIYNNEKVFRSTLMNTSKKLFTDDIMSSNLNKKSSLDDIENDFKLDEKNSNNIQFDRQLSRDDNNKR